jgi:DNA-binding IclR family transcriptional regulator
MPLDEQERVLSEVELKRHTPNTVGNLQELQTELYRVRKNGYACDLEEHEMYIRCVAAPIWDHTGCVQASLSLTAPVVRMPVARLRQLAPIIQAAGLEISRELGYQPKKTHASRTSVGKNGAAEARLERMAL